MRTSDDHQGCSTLKELKKSFKSVCKQQIEEESKDPLTYQGNARRLILKRMNPQTCSLMEQLGLPITRGTEMFNGESGGGKTLMTRMMGKWSSRSGVLVQTTMLGMHGIGAI